MTRQRPSLAPLCILLTVAALHAGCGGASNETAGATTTTTTGATTTDTTTTDTTTSGTTSTGTGSGGASTGGGGGSGGESAGGAGGAPALHPGAGEPCDVLAQDCKDPAAAKCALGFSDPAELPSTCQPAIGEKQAGEACSRPNEKAGEDDCAPGLYCSPAENPVGAPQPRTCFPLCDTNEVCGAGKFCTRFNANPNGPLPADARLVGICVTRCDFWDPAACAAGTRCLTTPSIDGGQSLQDNGICIGTKGAKKGEPCAANADCDIGLGCGGDKLCGTYCDGAHPTCDPDTETCPSQVPSQVALCAPK